MENNQELHPLLRRAIIFIENKEYGSADDYCEKYLDTNPEDAYAYVIKLMCRVKVAREEDLITAVDSFREWNSYRNAYRFADPELKERLEMYLLCVEERIRQEKEEEQNLRRYTLAKNMADKNDIDFVSDAIRIFQSLGTFQDAARQAELAQEKFQVLQEKRRLEKQQQEIRRQQEEKRAAANRWIVFFVVAAIVALVFILSSFASEGAELRNEIISGATHH